jgi:protein TonB
MKNNIHIMKSLPQVSDEEINQHIDFDGLLTLHKTHQQKVYRRNTIVAAALATAVVVLSVWMLNTAIPENPSPSPRSAIPSDSSAIRSALPAATDPVPPRASREKNKYSAKPNLTLPQKADSSQQESKDTYNEAEPVNGYPALYDYFDRELHYPIVGLKDSIQGTVSVSFIVDREGKPKEITILHSLGVAFDQESIRLINQMPPWKPASMNGKNVRAKITIPLTFTITKNTHP